MCNLCLIRLVTSTTNVLVTTIDFASRRNIPSRRLRFDGAGDHRIGGKPDTGSAPNIRNRTATASFSLAQDLNRATAIVATTTLVLLSLALRLLAFDITRVPIRGGADHGGDGNLLRGGGGAAEAAKGRRRLFLPLSSVVGFVGR